MCFLQARTAPLPMLRYREAATVCWAPGVDDPNVFGAAHQGGLPDTDLVWEFFYRPFAHPALQTVSFAATYAANFIFVGIMSGALSMVGALTCCTIRVVVRVAMRCIPEETSLTM